MNQDSGQLVYQADENGWRLQKQQPDGSFVEPSPEELALANALGTARACGLIHTTCECCGPFETELPKIIDRADVLLANLTELQHSLVDSAMRERLAKTHAEAVTYAGEVAPSYVEAIYKTGERLYATISMLCRHGVLFDYLSRLHPAQSSKLAEPWPDIPRVEKIEFTGMIAANGRGNHYRTPVQLLGAICKCVKALPAIDPDQAWVFLEKEAAAALANESLRRENPAPRVPRLVVSLNPPQVTIDGEPIALTCDEAACLKVLVDTRDWISSRRIGEQTSVVRSDRIIKTLREEKLNRYSIIHTEQIGSRIAPDWLA